MTAEDRTDGWWDAPAAETWTCPECGATTPVSEWIETPAGCEDCGEHDGRECPACGDVLDHVFGAPRIAEASGSTA